MTVRFMGMLGQYLRARMGLTVGLTRGARTLRKNFTAAGISSGPQKGRNPQAVALATALRSRDMNGIRILYQWQVSGLLFIEYLIFDIFPAS